MFKINVLNLKEVHGNTSSKIVSICSFIMLSMAVSLFYGGVGCSCGNNDNINYAFAATATAGDNGQNQQQTQQLQPNIDAKSIFETKTAVLGSNVKNLMVMIPDEAHHGNGEAKEARFIEQSFLPQKAIVNKGTNVIWFSGDVSHEHKIILNGKLNSFSPSPYDSGVLTEFTASTPVTFNAVGNYGYSSPEIDPKAEQKGFVMSGEIEVVNQPSKLAGTTPNTATAPPPLLLMLRFPRHRKATWPKTATATSKQWGCLWSPPKMLTHTCRSLMRRALPWTAPIHSKICGAWQGVQTLSKRWWCGPLAKAWMLTVCLLL